MKISSFLLLLFVLLFSACGGGDTQQSSADPSPYLSVSFAPAADDEPISIEKIVTVTFSETIDPLTADDDSVYIEDANQTHVPATITVAANKVTIIPTDYFKESSLYTLVVTTALKDLDGLRLEEAFSFTFKTSMGPDVTAPGLSAYTPSPGGSVSPDTQVVMTFDEMIVAEEAALLALVDDDTNQSISGVTTVSGYEIRFVPDSLLTYDGNYTVTLLGDVADVAGNVYDGSVTSWSFGIEPAPDTVAPSLVSLTPAKGTSADKATTVVMAFDEVIAQNAAVLAVSYSGTNTFITGTTTIENNAVSFIPDSELMPEEDYTVTLQGSVEDLAGNLYTGLTSWSFSVNPLADTTAPSLLSFTPADGTSADKSTEIIMAFDEDINATGIALEVRDASNALVAGTPTVDHNTIRFVPETLLTPEETYTATLQGTVQDLAGNAYVGVTTWSFSVNPLVDQTAPSLLSATPANGSTVDRSTPVLIAFDEELASNGATLQLRDGANAIVAGTSIIDHNTISFLPDDTLIPGSAYMMAIQGSVEDLAGNTYTGVTSWSFSTDPLPPTALTVTHIKYKSDNKITIEFYEKLDEDIVTENDFLLNGGAIAFTDFKFKDDGWQVELKAVSTLAGTETITISGDVSDRLGNVHNGGAARTYAVAGVLSVWDVTMKDDKVTVKFWELEDLASDEEVLDPSTIDATDFQIDGGAVSFSGLEIKDYEVKFTADTPLDGDEVITVSGDIQDKAGNVHNDGVAVQHTFR